MYTRLDDSSLECYLVFFERSNVLSLSAITSHLLFIVFGLSYYSIVVIVLLLIPLSSSLLFFFFS